MNTYATIDESRCRSCGTCVAECHRHLPVSRHAALGPKDMDWIHCYHCYAVCLKNAITIEGLNQDRVTGGNRHAHSFTVVTKREVRELLSRELNRIYSRRRRLLGSWLLRRVFSLFVDPRTRTFLLDPIYLKKAIHLLDQYARGEDPIFYRAPAIIVVHSRELIPMPDEDSVLAAYNIVLMVETLGLGTCLVSLAQNAINSSRRCKQILDLDPSERVYAVVVMNGCRAADELRILRGTGRFTLARSNVNVLLDLDPRLCNPIIGSWPQRRCSAKIAG